MPSSRPTHRIPTSSLYTSWASTYDHDSNVLQTLDDEAFDTHVALLLAFPSPSLLLDLGCGTGRNTIKLSQLLSPASKLIAMDANAAMLELAKQRISSSTSPSNVEFVNTAIPPITEDAGAVMTGVLKGAKANVVISTLVLEHLPLDAFFAAVAAALKVGGWAWVTDMNEGMGESRAGFVVKDEKGEGKGVKFQGESWNHGFTETVEAAGRVGLRLLEAVESGVEGEEDLKRLGERARKWVGKQVFLGMRFEKVA